MQGVRSVAFLDHLLSVGTGNGMVALWDRRIGQFLETPAADTSPIKRHSPAAPQSDATSTVTPASKLLTLELAGGFLERNDVYRQVSSRMQSLLTGWCENIV